MADRTGRPTIKAFARACALCVFPVLGVLACGLAMTPASALAQTKTVYQPQIEGSYSVQGVNPDGSRYSGRATITVKDGTAFIRWDIGSGTFHGQGPVTGNILVVDWGQAEPVVYQIQPDGTLAGTWAGGRATDTLRPLN